MEIRVILRGVLSGVVAGIGGFAFAWVFAEPVISEAIAYESGRDDILAALNKAAGRAVTPDGPEIFSRSVQSTVGIATGVIAFSAAMGALVAVAYLVLHGRFTIRPQAMAWTIAGFGFLGVYLLPFVKYPANPPAVGHSFTIAARGQLYLCMVACSLILLGLAVYLAWKLTPRFGAVTATVLAAVAFLVVYGVVIGVLPSPGNLHANVAYSGQFGYARAATETPRPIVNILSRPLLVDGKMVEPGQIVYPGFDPDVLWKFRWYSILSQLLIWLTIALVFGGLLERYILGPAPGRSRVPAAGGASEGFASPEDGASGAPGPSREDDGAVPAVPAASGRP